MYSFRHTYLLESDGPVNQIEIKVVQLEILESSGDGFARPVVITTPCGGLSTALQREVGHGNSYVIIFTPNGLISGYHHTYLDYFIAQPRLAHLDELACCLIAQPPSR